MQLLELKVPPPAVLLLFAVMMWLLAAYVPSLAMAVPWHTPVALMVWSAGVAIAVAAVLEFRRAKTTVNPLNPEAASAMVTSGIYRFSRNPMYLGLLFALLGWAVWLSHLLALASCRSSYCTSIAFRLNRKSGRSRSSSADNLGSIEVRLGDGYKL